MSEEALAPELQCLTHTFLSEITKPQTCPSFLADAGEFYTPSTPGWGYFWIVLITVYIARVCMGHSPSNIYKKTTNYFRATEHTPLPATNSVVVRQRRSSLQRDEDNDIAHEFYEEIKHHNGKSRMKKVVKTYPLGVVKLNVPCLHPDFVRIIIPNYDIAGQLNKQCAANVSARQSKDRL